MVLRIIRFKKYICLLYFFNLSSYQKLKQILPDYINYYNKNQISNDWIDTVKKSGGKTPEILDELAIFYCLTHPTSYISIVWPSSLECDKSYKIIDILKKHGEIIYNKKINIKNNAPFLLLRHTYRFSKWLGNWENNFIGIKDKKMYKRFPRYTSDYTIEVYLLNYKSFKDAYNSKIKARQLCNLGYNSIHMTDNQEESISLAKVLFNNNSINFINNAKINPLKNFDKVLSPYSRWILKNYNSNNFCAISNSTKALFGKIKTKISFINNKHKIKKIPDFCKHKLYDKQTADNIIHDPRKYFYYDEVKFMALK